MAPRILIFDKDHQYQNRIHADKYNYRSCLELTAPKSYKERCSGKESYLVSSYKEYNLKKPFQGGSRL